MSSERERAEERYRLAVRDLEELAQQVEDGEIDAETAGQLEAGYRRELDESSRDLKAVGEPVDPARDGTGGEDDAPAEDSGEADEPAPPARPARSPVRVAVGAGIIIAALSVTIFMLARSSDADPAAAGPAGTIDPSAVTSEQLEAVVAQNPDINPMRLALADRYFEEGNYSRALEHYLVVAENAPTPGEESRALARIGWMAYVTGQHDAAVEMVSQSVGLDGANLEAKLYLGMINLYGLDDAAAAIPLLEEVAATPGLPEELKAEIDSALTEARAREGGE